MCIGLRVWVRRKSLFVPALKGVAASRPPSGRFPRQSSRALGPFDFQARWCEIACFKPMITGPINFAPQVFKTIGEFIPTLLVIRKVGDMLSANI